MLAFFFTGTNEMTPCSLITQFIIPKIAFLYFIDQISGSL